MIPPVKRLLSFALMFWFALQAGLAQAHMTVEDLHQIEHAAHAQQHGVQTDADHNDEPCGTSHCCHPVGPVAGSGDAASQAPAADIAAPVRTARWHLPWPDIERPKWALATPAVASL